VALEAILLDQGRRYLDKKIKRVPTGASRVFKMHSHGKNLKRHTHMRSSAKKITAHIAKVLKKPAHKAIVKKAVKEAVKGAKNKTIVKKAVKAGKTEIKKQIKLIKKGV